MRGRRCSSAEDQEEGDQDLNECECDDEQDGLGVDIFAKLDGAFA